MTSAISKVGDAASSGTSVALHVVLWVLFTFVQMIRKFKNT